MNSANKTHSKNKIAYLAFAAILFVIGISSGVSAKPKVLSLLRAECGNGEKLNLVVLDERVYEKGMPSSINYKSVLELLTSRKNINGSTSIFYGGQSQYFSSFDKKTRFNATYGFGGGQNISEAELSLQKGVYSCIIKK